MLLAILLICTPRPSMPQKLSMPLKFLVSLRLAALESLLKSYANRIAQSFFVQLSRDRGNEEKREAGGQGESSVGLAGPPGCRVTASNVALKKAARSWEAPMRWKV